MSSLVAHPEYFLYCFAITMTVSFFLQQRRHRRELEQVEKNLKHADEMTDWWRNRSDELQNKLNEKEEEVRSMKAAVKRLEQIERDLEKVQAFGAYRSPGFFPRHLVEDCLTQKKTKPS